MVDNSGYEIRFSYKRAEVNKPKSICRKSLVMILYVK